MKSLLKICHSVGKGFKLLVAPLMYKINTYNISGVRNSVNNPDWRVLMTNYMDQADYQETNVFSNWLLGGPCRHKQPWELNIQVHTELTEHFCCPNLTNQTICRNANALPFSVCVTWHILCRNNRQAIVSLVSTVIINWNTKHSLF